MDVSLVRDHTAHLTLDSTVADFLVLHLYYLFITLEMHTTLCLVINGMCAIYRRVVITSINEKLKIKIQSDT